MSISHANPFALSTKQSNKHYIHAEEGAKEKKDEDEGENDDTHYHFLHWVANIIYYLLGVILNKLMREYTFLDSKQINTVILFCTLSCLNG